MVIHWHVSEHPLLNMSPTQPSISRRDFLKLSGMGIAGMFLYNSPLPSLNEKENQGRVIRESITVYDKPSFAGKKIKVYWQDAIIPISGITLGSDQYAYNRIWYKIGTLGYAYSGYIQPVKTILNPVVNSIPKGGALAELTVPYSDAHWEPDERKDVAYRFYYETTHWIVGTVLGANNDAWYRIMDDKWELTYFVLARHLRIIPFEELQPISPHIPPDAKRIEVRTKEQLVIAYEYNKPVFVARAATGAKFSNGNYSTPSGTHYTFHKRPFRHMAAGNLAYNGYDLPGVPWICYFTERGVALHGTYWHNDYGKPRSHGCVNLTPKASKWFYLWTNPYVPPAEQFAYKKYGTRIDVL